MPEITSAGRCSDCGSMGIGPNDSHVCKGPPGVAEINELFRVTQRDIFATHPLLGVLEEIRDELRSLRRSIETGYS